MNLAKNQDIKFKHTNQLHFYILIINHLKIKKIFSFAIPLQIIKYLRINQTKEVKDLYNENYKTLTNKIKEDINKWKNISHSGLGLSIVKISIVHKVTYRFNAISIKM